MKRNLLRLARRALGKPPAYVARRALQELQAEAERFLAPRRARNFSARHLLERTGARSIADLWSRLAARPYVAVVRPIAMERYDSLCPGDAERILRLAERALAHRVDLLGSGDIELGEDIDWQRDYKSGFRWPAEYFRNIDYVNAGRPSDVKFPWDLSRLHWLVPCGQAWLLTGQERWAAGARRVIENWIEANPYAASVNWACTMEAAMRIFTWTWLFHAFSGSAAWADEGFRARFLCSLYLHGDFTERNVEYADVNGNHCDADAAALVFAGLFFEGVEPQRWLERGWKILTNELFRQVSPDGVDFEGSVPYHRLVSELFFLPALYRKRCGLSVPPAYEERIKAMAWFTEAYTAPDGRAPVWGDADDARAVPFGGQAINDHRYLIGWIGASFDDAALLQRFSGDRAECIWLLGPDTPVHGPSRKLRREPEALVFRDGGYAILRNDLDHVFIDCGPVGTAGRGGHGHNDVLSFEAVLSGEWLIADSGAYVYTADFAERNAFRSTAYHNTPRIDEQEVNRFVGPNELWSLHYDARPQLLDVSNNVEQARLVASHSGYQRLGSPVTPKRTFTLAHSTHMLTVRDDFEGTGEHRFEIPLTIAPGVNCERHGQRFLLKARKASYWVDASDSVTWQGRIEPARVSISYGRVVSVSRLVWRRVGSPAAFELRLTAAA